MLVLTDIKIETTHDMSDSGIAGKSYVETSLGQVLIGWSSEVKAKITESELARSCIITAITNSVNGTLFTEEVEKLKSDIDRYYRYKDDLENKAKILEKKVSTLMKKVNVYIDPQDYETIMENYETPIFKVNIIRPSLLSDWWDKFVDNIFTVYGFIIGD